MADIQVTPQVGNVVQLAASGTANDKAQSNEELASLKETVIKLEKQLNFLSAQTRVASKQPDPTPTQAQEVTLKSLKAEMDARDARLKERAIKTEIRSFAKGSGVSDEALPFFEAYIEKNYSSKLTTDAEDRIVFEDDLGEKQPFAILGKKILASAGGLSLLPAVSTPGRVGGRSTANGVVQQNIPNLAEMSIEDMMKNPALADAAVQQAAAFLGQQRTVRT
jgi:hypothetical protein